MYIFDLHCDTLLKLREKSIIKSDGHINLQKLLSGNVKKICFAVFPEDEHFYKPDGSFLYYQNAVKLFKQTQNTLKKHNISAYLTIEDSELINGDLNRITKLKRDGVILASLLWNRENCMGYPHFTVSKHLKPFGFEAAEKFYSENILIDVSHLNYAGFFDIANNFKKPIVASHSACFSLCEHTRNLTDRQLKAIGNSGGIAGIPFYCEFLNKNSFVTKADDILRHIEYAVSKAGCESVGIGSDFDGFSSASEIKDASYLNILTQKIIDRFGYETAEKICFKNANRVFNM